jgi:hypothetical protein
MCQLDMLFEAIEALEVRCLWIDTISVPINPKFKRRAISKLRETYTMATKVLVVDRRLMQFGSHWMERRLQVLASEWMGRLWTLQEGRLASELYFQFKDKAVGATELVDAHPNEEHEDLASLSRCFAHTGKENRVYFEKQDSVIKKFLNLIEDLSPRSVTFASDEPICIATLLGLKLEDFHPYPTMVDIYRSMEAIPPEVLFLTAPKINLPGFRWAPTTFLELDRRWFIYPDRQSAKLTPRGLELTKDCIFLSGDIEIKKGNMYFVNQSTDDSKSTFAFQRSNNSRADSKTKTFKYAAIIIERSEDTFTGSSSGVLVSVASTDTGKRSSFIKSTRRLLKSKKKEEPIHCTFEMQLVVFPVNESTTPEIERRLAWPDSKSINLSGDFCRDVEFCVD